MVLTVHAQDVSFNENGALELKQVIFIENATKVTVNTKQIYPEYDGSKLPSYVKLKQAVIEYGPKIPDSMQALVKILNEKISKVEDDF